MYGRKSNFAYLRERRRKRTWRMDRVEKEDKRRREEIHVKEMYETEVFKKFFQLAQEDNYVYNVI